MSTVQPFGTFERHAQAAPGLLCVKPSPTMRFTIGGLLLIAAAFPASDAFLAPASSLLRTRTAGAAVSPGRFMASPILQRRATAAAMPLRMQESKAEVDYQTVTVNNIRNCAIIAHVSPRPTRPRARITNRTSALAHAGTVSSPLHEVFFRPTPTYASIFLAAGRPRQDHPSRQASRRVTPLPTNLLFRPHVPGTEAARVTTRPPNTDRTSQTLNTGPFPCRADLDIKSDDGGDRAMDNLDIERERGITIMSKVPSRRHVLPRYGCQYPCRI